MNETRTHLQQQIIDVALQGKEIERDAAVGLSPAERDVSGTTERWALKDEVLHINTLKAVLVDSLAAGREGREPPPQGEFQARNDATFTQSQTMTWDEVTATADHTVEALIAEIERHDDTRLRQALLYAWMRAPHTIVTEVLGQCMAHAFQHLSRYHLWRGESAKALALHDVVLSAYEVLAPSPYWLGKAHYNRAGAYAIMGDSNKAIPLLVTAFMLRPDLVELARQDSDMELLRAVSAFQALLK